MVGVFEEEGEEERLCLGMLLIVDEWFS